MHNTLFQAGQYCGDYRIEKLLGAGGYAEVYRALCVKTNESVALKVLHARHSENAGAKEKLRAEAEFLSSVSHVNLVRVHGLGRHLGVMFMAMEYLDGKTLREWLDESGGRLPLMQALYVAREIADGIDAAHELGVVHRDLKPENVFITKERKVKVLDLGAAKFFGWNLRSTAPGQVVGTPMYMAPEHVRGLKVDVRVDIYALGVMLYEMIGGHFLARQREAGLSKYEAAMMQLTVVPLALKDLLVGCPDDVSEMVAKAMEKDPAHRFQSMSAFAKAIRNAQGKLKKNWGLRSTGQLGAPAPAEKSGSPIDMSDDDDEDTTKKRRADSVQNKKPVSFVFEVESGEALTRELKPSVSQAIYAFVEGARRGKARRHGRRAASKSPIPNSQKPLRPTALEPTGPMQMPVFKEAHEGSGLRSDELATLPFRRLLLAGEADEQAQKEEAVEPPARLSDGSQERAAEQTELSAAGDRNTQGHAARRPWRVGPFWLVVACLLGMAGMWALPRFLEGDSKGEAWTRPSGEAIRAEDISSLSKGEASAPPKREAEPAQLSTAKPEAQNLALSEAKAEVNREEAAPEKNAPKKKAMLAPAPKAPKNEGLIEAAPRAKSPRKTSAPPKPTLIFE